MAQGKILCNYVRTAAHWFFYPMIKYRFDGTLGESLPEYYGILYFQVLPNLASFLSQQTPEMCLS